MSYFKKLTEYGKSQLGRLRKIGNDVKGIVNETLIYAKTAEAFSEASVKINQKYRDLKNAWVNFADSETERNWKRGKRKTEEYFRKRQIPRKLDDTRQQQAIGIFKKQIKLDGIKAFERGRLDVQDLFVKTQQSQLEEIKINRALKKSLDDPAATPKILKSDLQKKLEKAVGKDGKIVTTGKTGKERRYSPETYAAIVSSTRLAEAQNQATIETALDYGVDLVRWSTHAGSCPLCLPYQGQVFSISGTHPEYPPMPAFPVHPFERHTLTPFIEESGARGRRQKAQIEKQAEENKKRLAELEAEKAA